MDVKALSGIIVIITLHCVISVNSEDIDARCKCVCATTLLPNRTNPAEASARVFIKPFHDHSLCVCQNVVDKAIQEAYFKFCDRCECHWQRRNSAVIKFVVILIICVISLLFLYMLFLLCLDPLMSRRPKSYMEHQNEHEEVNLDTQALHREDNVRPRKDVMSRVKQEVSKVRGEQQRWKGQVQEQRKHIYDTHTMLN